MQRVVSCMSRRGFLVATSVTCAGVVPVNGIASQLGKGGGSASASRVIGVDAKPDRIELDLARTAVIVVDMQNDFAAKGGLVHRLGFNIEPIRATIRPISQVLSAGRASKLKI